MGLSPPMAHQSGHFILKIVGTLSLAIHGRALVEDALTSLQNTRLPMYHHVNTHEYYEENYDYYEDEMRETPVKQLEYVLKNHDDNAHINTISTFLSVPHQPHDVFLTLIVTASLTNPGLKVPTSALLLQHLLGSLAPYLQLNNALLVIKRHLYARQLKIMFYLWDG